MANETSDDQRATQPEGHLKSCSGQQLQQSQTPNPTPAPSPSPTPPVPGNPLQDKEMQLAQTPTPSPSPGPVVVRPRQPRRASVRPAVPDSILNDPELQRALASSLPPNYSFEVPKTVWRVKEARVDTVALQFPEGLLMYATTIADILERFAGVKQCIILGDVTYGACCIDDTTASMLGAQLLVHYGHSCLVPVGRTVIPCLYVFVGLTIDTPHLVSTVEHNLPAPTPLVLAGTIQFGGAVQQATSMLREHGRRVTVPQAKPLSPGEVLGCTAPSLREDAQPKIDRKARRGTTDMLRSEAVEPGPGASSGSPGAAPGSVGEGRDDRACAVTEEGAAMPGEEGRGAGRGEVGGAKGTGEVLVFVADGRFHLEAMMIANPHLEAYRYDPFTRRLLREAYDHRGMRRARRGAVQGAAQAQRWGVVLGTLGRQGNPSTLRHVCGLLRAHGRHATVFLVSELSPAKVAQFEGEIAAWVQIACPRLSIDWGEAFCAPLLTPYELTVALREAPQWRGAAEIESSSQAPEGEPKPKESHQPSAPEEGSEPRHSARGGSCEGGEQGELRDRDLNGSYPMDYYAKQGLGSWSRSWPVTS